MSDLSKASRKYMAEVDANELACRMLEGMQGMVRPEGKSAVECLRVLDKDSQIWIMRGAHAALQYVSECFAGAGRVE